MTENLASLLAANPGSAIYRLGGRAGAKKAALVAEDLGWRFLYLDAGEVADKPAFLTAAAKALHFPEWAGHNWDAFEELVNDLSWLDPAPGHVLLLDHLGNFAERHSTDMRVIMDILESAVARRGSAGERPLIVLVRGAGAAARRFPALALQPPEPACGTITEQHDA